jgi:ubiquinone/menaquinone biosynthesis C-methylase UbiE
MPDPEQWQLSGNAAEQYEKIPARYIVGPWTPGLVETAEIQRDERILDVACGTGLVTRAASLKLGPAGHITGLDLNEGMLEVGKSLGVPGPGDLAWVKCSALEMDFPDGDFDVVLCQQGLQFFPDQRKALKETHRVLRDGGRAYFRVWARADPYTNAVGAALAKVIDENASRRYLVALDVPDADVLQSMFSEVGFGQVNVEHIEMEVRLPEIEKFILAHLRGTPVADAVESLSESKQSALAGNAIEDLSAYADGPDVVVPYFINLVLAKK